MVRHSFKNASTGIAPAAAVLASVDVRGFQNNARYWVAVQELTLSY